MIHIFHFLSNYKKKCVRILTFSHYLEHSAPLFKQLDILNFKALVTKRISLLMYKIHMESAPLPISNVCISGPVHPIGELGNRLGRQSLGGAKKIRVL